MMTFLASYPARPRWPWAFALSAVSCAMIVFLALPQVFWGRRCSLTFRDNPLWQPLIQGARGPCCSLASRGGWTFVFLTLLLGGSSVSLAETGLQLSPRTDLREVQRRLRPRRIALLIGISRYLHRSWNDLRYPAEDAKKMRKFLLKEGHFDEVMLLTKPRQTRRAGVLGALRWLKGRVRSPADTVLIYVSGHGSIAQSKPGRPPERYLITTDSSADLPRTAVAIRSLKYLLQRLPSRRKALILASCYVGTQRHKLGQAKAPASGIKGTYSLGGVSRTTLILSAAGYMQPAYEIEQLRGDVYTHFLLTCARKKARQKKKATATTIHRCATQRTYRYVKRILGREQIPAIESKITGQDNIYLVGKEPSRSASGSSSRRSYGWLRLKRGRFRRIALRPKGSKGPARILLPGQKKESGFLTLRLPAGHYSLTLVTPSGQQLVRHIQIEARSHQVLTGTGLVESAEDAAPLEWGEGGPFLELGGDLQGAPQTLLGLRMGIWTRYFSGAVSLFAGFGLDQQQNKPFGDVLFRFGLPLQAGFPLEWGSFDIFFNLYTEIGLWTIRDEMAEMAFFFAYGPNIRLRWWFSPHSALRLSLGVFFSLSPDERNPRWDIFDPDSPKHNWSHRFQVLVAVGFDFSAAPR